MANLDPIHEDSTEAEIVAYCSNPDRPLVGGVGRVVKLCEDYLVKFGADITEDVASSFTAVYKLVDQSIARTPRVHNFFKHDGKGYLVMELIHGHHPSPEEWNIVTKKVANLLTHLTTITSELIGPPAGGISRGLLWERDNPNFGGNAKLMEDWFNTRIPKDQAMFETGSSKFSLCHLDLAPHNIICLENGSIGVIDWDSAGFYPRSVEVAMLELMVGDHYHYNQQILKLLAPTLDETEKKQSVAVQFAWLASDRFYFKPTAISNRTWRVYDRNGSFEDVYRSS